MVQAVDKVMLNIWLRKMYGPTTEQEDWEVCRKMELCIFMMLYYESSCMKEIIKVTKTCKSRQPGRRYDLNP